MKKKYKITGFIPPLANPDKAQEYGEFLHEVTEENDGTLTPQLVVDKAKDEESPIHECFEWDNTIAGNDWRKQQARQLIRSIVIEVKWDHTTREQNEFHNVTITSEDEEEKNQRVYVTLDRVLSEPYIKKQVIAAALKEIQFWQEKYNQYKELGTIFKAVDKTKRDIKKKLKIEV